MNTRKIESNSFWLDTLTLARYEKKRDIPMDIPLTRMQHWDSQLEFNFYLKLLKIFPKEIIHPHFPVMLLPKNDTFPQLDWDIDFSVASWFIECKGDYISSNENGIVRANFLKTLRLFQERYPLFFANFLLVGTVEKRLGRTKIQIITPDQAIERIKNGNKSN